MLNKKRVKVFLKKTTIYLIVLTMILGGLVLTPKTARASVTVESQPDDYNYYDVFKGPGDTFAMSVFALSSDNYPNDTLDEVKINIQGSITAGEIAAVKIYQENEGDTIFNEGGDTLLGGQTNITVGSGTSITINTSAVPIPATSTRYYVVITLNGTLTDNNDLRVGFAANQAIKISASWATTNAFGGYSYAIIDLGGGGGGEYLYVEDAEYVGATTVDVIFNKEVNQTSAETVGNYTFGGGTISGNPDSAVLQPGNTRVRLIKSGVTFDSAGRDSVTVNSSVTDLVGNANQSTGPMYIMGGGGSGGSMIVISEVQVAGAVAKDEFIELYNTTGSTIDLSSPQVYLHIVNSSGSDENKTLSFTNTTIAANGFFLIAAASTYDGAATADATYDASSDNTLTDNSAVYLSYSTTSFSGIIDKVGWGQSGVYEGGMAVNTSYSAVSWGPAANGSIERKANYSSTAATMAAAGADVTNGNDNDTDDNYGDFVIQTVSEPQNTSSVAETPGGAGYGGDNTPPMIMHMNVFRAIKSNATLDIAARMSDESGVLTTSNTILYYCASGSGTSCDEAGEFTSVTGSAVGSGYFKFQIPASIRNASNIETNDIRYILKAIDPVDSAKVMYMSQSMQADDTCNYSPYTCDTTTIFANPFVIDVLTSAQATSYSCDQTISGTITESGSGLGSVYTFLEGTAISDISRSSGYFVFSNVCPGSYQIIGVKEGYMDGMYWASAGETGISMSMNTGYTGGGGDYTKPYVMYSMPNDMIQGYPTSENIYVIFNSAMESSTVTGGVDNSNNIYLTDGSNVAAGIVTYSSTNTGRSSGAPTDDYLLIYNPTSDLTPGINYTLVINANVVGSNGQSIEGNRTGGGYSLIFATAYDLSSGGTHENTYNYGYGANSPPYVVAISPGGGAFDVSLNTKINIVFNEPMSSSSINTTNITMYAVSNLYTANEQETAFTNFSVVLDSTGEIAIITPSSNLTASTHYRIKVWSDTTSAKGTVMSQATTLTEMFSSNFETGSTSDSTAPTIAGTYPSDGDTGIPANLPSVDVGFSEAMDPATITSNTVKLKQGNTTINSIIEYDVGERAVHIMPSVALNPGATYTIEVLAGSSGVSDISGNYLADQSSILAGVQNYTATFTVSTTEDTDYPTIQFADCDDFSCAITFSEPMNSARVGEADYTAGYSVLDRNNYQIKEGPAGTTDFSGISVEDLSSINIEYDQMNNTIRITGLSLNSANDFELTVSNTGDRFINSNNESVHQINGTGTASFMGPISNSYETGGMMGPGGPGPMMGPPSMTGGATDVGMSGAMGFDFGGHWEQPTDVMPMNMTAGATTKYFVGLPIGVAIPSGGTIVLTFPSGFNVSSADAVSTTYSMANKDINGPASGTPTISSVATSITARTITVTTSGTIAVNDYLMFDLKDIKNSTVPRGFDTNGYTVDIKTKDASGKLLESLTSFPFFLNEAGDYTLSGTITAAGATGGATTVYLNSWMTGPMEDEVTFSAGSASYSFTGLSEGDYNLFTEPSISLTGGNYTGYMKPDPIFINSSTCVSNTCTKNFSFTKQDSSTAFELTVYIVGDFSGMDVGDSDIDIFAGGSTGFAVTTIDVSQANCTGISCSYNLYLPSTGDWWVGMGPAMPQGTMMMGPPPTPSWMSPGDINISVSGSYASPTWTEQSGTANDGKITFTVTAASNEIIGYVVDSSGTAIANVDVDAFRTQGGFGMPSHGVTDTNGKFTLKVTTGIYEVNAWMPGLPWSPGRIVDVRADTDSGSADGNSTADVYKDNGTTLVVDLISGYDSNNEEAELLVRLNKSSTTISGKLLDDSGNPVAYAPVWAYDQSTGMYMPSGTDSSGNYTIYADVGNWYVEAFIPGIGDVSYANNPVSITSGSSASDINIRPASDVSFSTISGTITIAGSVVTNASVWVDRGTYYNNTNTNSSGEYRLRVPANSGYSLKAWTPEYGELDPVTVNASSDVTQDFTVLASAMHTLTLNFTNSSNLDSNTEAFIDIFDPSVYKGNHIRIDDLSNTNSTTIMVKDGSNYEIHMFIPGLGGIEATCADGANIICTAVVGDMPDTWAITGDAAVTFALPDVSDLYTFTVTVTTNASSTPVLEDAFVWIGGSLFHTGEPTNSFGVATIKIPAGNYELGGDKPGYTGPAPITIIASNDSDYCTSNACTKSLTLVVNSYTLSGTVTNPNGGAVSNAWIWADKVTSATDFSFAGGWTGTETNPDGTYELSISDGYWLVRAVSDAYEETTYTVAGAPTAIQISGASQSNKNITLSARSGYTAIEPKSAPITPASGGTIDDTGAGGTGVKLIIPPSVLGTGTSAGTISIKDTYSVPSTGNIVPLGGKGKNITATNSSGQAIVALSGSATIEISYDESDLPLSGLEGQLMLVYFDDSSNQWVEVPSSQDLTNNVLSGDTTHFSIYAIALTADDDAPTTSGTPSATSTSTTSVTFSWTASTDTGYGLAGYEVMRSTDGTNFSTISGSGVGPDDGAVWDATKLVTDTSYTDSGLESSTTYYYQVIAWDNATPNHNHSASSGTLTVTTSTPTGGGSAPTTPVSTTGQGNVTQNLGGEVKETFTSGKTAKVDFAAGTVEGTIVVKVEAQDETEVAGNNPLPSNTQIVGDLVADFTATSGGVILETFEKEVTITFTYEDTQITGLNESTLTIYYWDGAGNQWVALESTVNTTDNIVEAKTTHFTYFALLGELILGEEEGEREEEEEELSIVELRARVEQLKAQVIEIITQLIAVLQTRVLELQAQLLQL